MSHIHLHPQKIKLPISELKSLTAGVENSRHGALFPNNIRALICGPSGSGKTNLLFSLLTHPNGIRFKNIYIVSKSLEQEKYKLLRNIFAKVTGLKSFFLDFTEDLPTPDQCLPNSVVIIDDVLCLKADKDKIRGFFCFGRHKNIDIFYLYQTYTHIDKHLLRDNCNLIILFSQDFTNLKHVYDDHLIGDVTFEDFTNICRICWRERFGFVAIIKENDINNGKIRKGIDNFISIS